MLTDEHLDDLLPSGETLDKDIGGFELMRGSVLLDLACQLLVSIVDGWVWTAVLAISSEQLARCYTIPDPARSSSTPRHRRKQTHQALVP